MEIYTKMLLTTTDPDCIVKTMNRIFDTKHYNYIVDITQPHFGECYRNETKIWKNKCNILEKLYQDQLNI